jgi:trigger factor
VVTLQQEDYLPAYQKALKNYSKQANIPGFRRGMVPVGVIKKMYGAGIFTEEVLKTVEKEVNQYLDQERPAIFGQPLPTEANNEVVRSLNQNEPKAYNFVFEIGLQPDVVPADLSAATIRRLKVEVTEEQITQEVERVRSRYGNLKEPETVESDECVLNISFTETNAQGEPLTNGLVHETNSLIVKYFAEPVRPRFMNLKVGDSVVLTLGEAFEDKELKWVAEDLKIDAATAADRTFSMTITKIAFIEKRALDTEFFEQLFPGKAIATEAEFREAMKADIQAYWDNQARTLVQHEIYQYLLDNTGIEFPEAFLKRWMLQTGDRGKTIEEVEAEFPRFLKQLKWTLISDHLVKAQNITVTPDELRQYARLQILGYMGISKIDEKTAWVESYVDNMMQDKKYIDENYHRLLTDKLFSWAETQVNYADEVVSVETFQERQQQIAQ